jgi:hypothetical protein
MAVCPDGTYYDELLDMCKYTPNIKKVCFNGDLLVESGGIKYCGTEAYADEICSENVGKDYFKKISSDLVDSGYLCLRNADEEYEPCEEGYINSNVGTCVKEPQYDDTVTCPDGYEKVGEICVIQADILPSCNPGYSYDPESGACSRIMPSKYYCEREGGTWSPTDSMCYQQTTMGYNDCPDEMEGDSHREACIMDRPVEYTYICEEGTLNPITLKCDIPGEANPVDPIVGDPICLEGEYNQDTKQCEVGSSVIVGPTPAQKEEAEILGLILAVAVFIIVSAAITGIVLTKIPK